MLYIRSLREGLPVFRALGSSTRIAIMELLIEKGPLRMTSIAQQLGITGGALTSHVKELTDAGLIYIETTGGKHGLQKICHAYDRRILVESAPTALDAQSYQEDLQVGSFDECTVSAPCGLARLDGIIEPTDTQESFAATDRARAGLVWFAQGELVYRLKNPLQKGDKALELNISMELASFATTPDNTADVDVTLTINGTPVGTWAVAPGRTSERSPHGWWRRGWPQHGHLYLFSISAEGAFIDGKRISSAKIGNIELGEEGIALGISANPGKSNAGGLMMYGQTFGHHEQDIRTLLKYRHGKQK